MEFNESDIWNQPVPERAAPAEPSTPVAPVAGRLYASAGAAAHPDAIVALPHHTRAFVSVADLPDPVPDAPAAPAPAPQAPIISDPAIAEMLQPVPREDPDVMPSFEWAESPEAPADPFKDWYADPVQPAAEPAAPVKTGLDAQQLSDAALRARTQLQGLGERVTSGGVGLARYSAIAIVFTGIVGIVDALVSGTIGLPFGIALLVSTGFGAFKLKAADAWVGWVMPTYVAISAILISGQFADGAPGASIVGQVLLVGTTIITIAPWLALSALLGVIASRFRRN